MQGNRLVLPSGTLAPVRGDTKQDSRPSPYNQASIAAPLSPPTNNKEISTLDQLLNPAPSSSTAIVKHDQDIAKITSQAYQELARLSQVAAIAAASSSDARQGSRIATRQQTRSSRTPSAMPSSSSCSMFIKSKPKKVARGTDVEILLDRNRNLLKSREVCRLLSSSQLDKLKSDTLELEKSLKAKRENDSAQELEESMVGLRVDKDDNIHPTSLKSSSVSLLAKERGKRNFDSALKFFKTCSLRINLQTIRPTPGRAKLISAEENAKLQRANFEAELELQRVRQYESIDKQMGTMNLVTSDSRRHWKSNTIDREEDVDVLGLGRDRQDINMTVQESDEW